MPTSISIPTAEAVALIKTIVERFNSQKALALDPADFVARFTRGNSDAGFSVTVVPADPELLTRLRVYVRGFKETESFGVFRFEQLENFVPGPFDELHVTEAVLSSMVLPTLWRVSEMPSFLEAANASPPALKLEEEDGGGFLLMEEGQKILLEAA